MKPTGKKSYGSIPHLFGSKKDQTDKYITEGQHNICTTKTRDNKDRVIVQEKYDGSNTGIAKVDGQIFPLVRAGYKAETSPYKQHHVFNDWVYKNTDLFAEQEKCDHCLRSVINAILWILRTGCQWL